jgi:coenzyme F420-reducing hydrogenase beta subunit
MNKVGIITWIRYQNYGTVLQATALADVIHKMGYNPVEIDYRPRSINDDSRFNFYIGLNDIKKRIKNIFNRLYESPRKTELYDNYLFANLSMTIPCNTEPELRALNEVFDAFVCGSDQIWTPVGFNDKYFLSFVNNPEKMVAYAPSLGLPEIKNPVIAKKMKILINRFKHLSVREQKGAEIIQKLCNKKAEVVLDPTLLVSSREWGKIEEQADYGQKNMPEKYIICYFLGDYSRYMKKVKEMSKALNMPYFVIPQFKKQAHKSDAVPFEVGPAEFLKLWAHASYAIIDSFHGLAFSLNYNIPFTVFKRFRENDSLNQNSRILNILKITGMEKRLADENRLVADSELLHCDFERSNKILAEKKAQSLQYLEKALASAITKEKIEPQNVADLSLCCGCSACAAVCPTGAISIAENDKGFLHNQVAEEKCIHCKKCLRVCPFHQVQAMDLKNAMKLVAYQSAEKQHQVYSSSGGFSADLAASLNKKGYSVYGVIYNSAKNQAEHISITPNSVDELSKIQGSKYLQSHTENSFKEIQNTKSNGRFVFFGTPCQVAALDKQLRLQNRRQDAVLVDLICHGVPSNLLWKKYLHEIETKYGIQQHPSVSFRSEKGGWHIRSIAITDGKKKYQKIDRKDPFYILFRNSLCDMETCYECPYRDKSSADIRMGDYWGPRYAKNEQGISMVIGITERGNQIIQDLGGRKKGYPLQDYWDVQYIYNLQKPLFYEDLLGELGNTEISLQSIRMKYAKGYETREKLGEIKNKLKSILRRK